MSHRQLFLFGAPRVIMGGGRVALPRRKSLALLAYLAVTGTPHTRESLSTLLWGDSDDQSASAYLRNTLWTLNKSFGSDWADTDGGAISFNAAAIYVDVSSFMAFANDSIHAEGAERLKRTVLAMDVYAGEFMAGFTLPDAPEFTTWQISTGETLRRTMIGVLMLRAECARVAGDIFAATDAAQRWLNLDPLDERAARLMMQVLAEGGEITAAIRQYHDVKRRLRESLGATPEPATVALFESLTTRAVPVFSPSTSNSTRGVPETYIQPIEAASAAAQVSQSGVTSITAEFPRVMMGEDAEDAEAFLENTYLVGREDERETLLSLIQAPDVRLVSIVAPGGMGKSLLARQVSSDARRTDAFPDGVYWISLAPLCASDVIVSTIASALPYPSGSGPDTETRLYSTISDKNLLLVLDNFEHLLDGAPILSKLLNAGPRLKAMITSRERLNLRNERVFELHGLSVPGERDDPVRTPFESVDLFVRRAQQADFTFTMSPQNAQDIARICRLVEGLPLALELAASWTPLLSCAEIVHELESNLDFLTSSSRDVPERHRSLRAVFASSWEQMTSAEQAVLAHLAVFRGGFRLEAASAVAGASPRVLLALVNKSLLNRRDDGRFSIHELLRQFSEGMLDPEARLDAVDKHIAYYAGLAAVEGVRMTTHEQPAALDVIQAEIDNIRSAWRNALARRKIEALDKMVEPILQFYGVRSRFDDLPEMIADTADKLTSETASERALLAKMLVAAAHVHIRDRHMTVIDAMADRALEVLRPLADRPDMGTWLILAAVLKRRPGRIQPEAEELIALGLQNLKLQGNVWGIGFALYQFGALQHMQMRYAEARETLNRALTYFEKVGQPWGIWVTLDMLAENMTTVGNYAAARDYLSRQVEPLRQLDKINELQRLEINLALLEQRGVHPHIEQFLDGLEQLRASGDRRGTAWAVYNLAWLYYLNQNYAEAEKRYFECLSGFVALGDDEGIIWSNIYLAEIALESGRRHAMDTYIEGARHVLADLNFPWGVAGLEYTLGNQALFDADLQLAAEHYHEAVVIAHGAQSIMQLLRHMTGVADIWQRRGRAEDAHRLLAFILQHPTTWDDTRKRANMIVEGLKQKLPSETAARLEDEGRALRLEDAVALSLG